MYPPPSGQEAINLLRDRFYNAFLAHQTLSNIRYRVFNDFDISEKDQISAVVYETDFIQRTIIERLGETAGTSNLELSLVNQNAQAQEYVVKSLTLPKGETRTKQDGEIVTTYNQSTLKGLWIETVPRRGGSGIFSQKLVGSRYIPTKQP